MYLNIFDKKNNQIRKTNRHQGDKIVIIDENFFANRNIGFFFGNHIYIHIWFLVHCVALFLRYYSLRRPYQALVLSIDLDPAACQWLTCSTCIVLYCSISQFQSNALSFQKYVDVFSQALNYEYGSKGIVIQVCVTGILT